MLGRFLRKFTCFSDAENDAVGEEIKEEDERKRECILNDAFIRSGNISIPTETSNWWLGHQAPSMPFENIVLNRMLQAQYLNDSRLKAYKMVPLSRRTTEEVRSDDSSIQQASFHSQSCSDQEDEEQSPNATSNDQTVVPGGAFITIGIIVRSRDDLIPRVIPLNPQRNVQSGEALLQAALSHEELARNGDSNCTFTYESHILYNTQSGKVELS